MTHTKFTFVNNKTLSVINPIDNKYDVYNIQYKRFKKQKTYQTFCTA